MTDLPEPIPAATLILMRPPRSEGAPEILMIERSETMAFAAGALVFPGGRIDPDDHVCGALFGRSLEDGAARMAAIRETVEETGIAPALSPAPDADTARALRAATGGHEAFSEILRRLGLTPMLDSLVPFARWCPNFRETRRFDTLFYLAEAPADAAPATADEGEAVRTFWVAAIDVLRDIEAGRSHAIFPTRRNLERLSRFSSIEEARADAARHPVRKITPWVEQREEGRFVCIPEDAGYPVTAEPFETARRR
jgi:8-oxo-dGTP pyrophosphatase MutT (NUDIX family)